MDWLQFPCGLELRLSAGTNGVMSAARAHEMAAMLDQATVSIDGLPAVHNRNRPTRSGQPSFIEVARSLSIFAEHGLAHGLRLTVTPDSLDQLPAGVAHLCEYTSGAVMQVEPAYPLGRYQQSPTVDPYRFIERFRATSRVAAAAGRKLRYSGARYPKGRCHPLQSCNPHLASF